MVYGALRYKFFVLACGRRSGKTSSNLFLGIEEQGQHEGFYYLGHISTDHAKAKEMFEAALKVLGGDPKLNPNSNVKRFQRAQGQDRWIEVHSLGPKNTGGKWYFWSGQFPNYEAIQGFMFPFHRLIVDEMQLQHPALVTQVVIPMSMDAPGKVLMEGHPKAGKPGNYLYRTYFLRGLSPDPEWKDYGALGMPFEANPFNDPAEGILGRKSCRTKQEEIEEYDGLFGDEEGAVFEKVAETCSLPLMKEPPAWFLELGAKYPLAHAKAWFGHPGHPRRKYVMGVDWAKERDYTSISAFDRTRNHQVALFRIQGAEYDEMFEWLKEIAYRYKGVIHGDGNGVGAAMGSLLRKRYRTGYREHKFHASNKENYVRRGQWHFNKGLVRLLNVPEQIHEFTLFQIIQPRSDDGMGGKHVALRFGHPPGEHDDFVDSYLMLAESLSASPLRERPEQVEAKDADPAVYTQEWFLQQAQARTKAARQGPRLGALTRYGG
ncbi:MAG: hypothetical protein ACE5F1_01020 [Planctomycetota bacterium]